MLKQFLLALFLSFFALHALHSEETKWMEINQKMIQLFKSGNAQAAYDLGSPYVKQIQDEFIKNQKVSADAVVFLVNQGILYKQGGQYPNALEILKLASECKSKIGRFNKSTC